MRRDDGGHDEVEFFGDGELLFGCRHVPAGEPVAGLVVCSPILCDFGANYQREVYLGRRLAAAGVVVQRYHPRGMGQSDGEGADLDVDSLVADAIVAAENLCRSYPVERLMVLGTRAGALAAGALAARLSGAPLALWEPTTELRRYVREGLRARAIHRMGRDAPVEEPEIGLARDGFVDVLGVPLGPGLYHAPIDRGLTTLVGDAPRPILLVQLEDRTDLRAEYRQLVDAWTVRGFDVTTQQHPSTESWWYVPDRVVSSADLVDATAAWLLGQAT
jgi:hypothetical protein